MTKEQAIKYLQQLYPNGGHCWLDEQRIEAIGMAIKALQEEHVSPCVECASISEGCKEICYDYNKWVRDNHKEKTVSKDLEEAATEICSKILKGETVVIDGYEYVVLSDAEECFKAGAKWQKEQFEKNRLKHCDSITNEQAELEQGFIDQHIDKYQRMPTFLDAIEYGMRLQKEQMMVKAIDVEVKVDAGGYPYIPQMELYDYDKDMPLAKKGDKYKVVLIKES